MDRGVLVVVGLLIYVHSALTGSETVWLNDLTDRFLPQKRVFGGPDLPDELAFHIRRRSGALTLTLKRNYEIDPNADIYFVKKTTDGRYIKSKSTTVEREALAYYQDMDNGAYMTVRCINSSNKRRERVISGNIRIGERSYDLQPAGTDTKPGNVMEVTDIIGRRYLLLDQTHIQQENGVKNKDAKELKELFQWYIPDGKQNNFDITGDTLSSSNLADLQDRGAPDTIRQLKQNYYVKVALCMDSGVWDLYSSKVNDVHPSRKRDEVKRRIREAYSHIMNGVNLRYKTIKDPSISISVIPFEFIFFLHEAMFPHNGSKVISENGTKYIGAKPYLGDFMDWDRKTRANDVQTFDHAMLFTTHKFYKDPVSNIRVRGMSNMRGVCDLGKRTSIVHARDYVWTVETASHELGHKVSAVGCLILQCANQSDYQSKISLFFLACGFQYLRYELRISSTPLSLGADHDGEGEAAGCKSEDFFIMSNNSPQVTRNRTHIANMWTFSICSVESFKKTLQQKECVKTTGPPYNINEYLMLMKKPAGYIFTPQEQCSLVYGQGYIYYGSVTEDLCFLLRCANPTTRTTKKIYLNAARGTKCGDNKWCIEGLCVSRSSQ